MPVLFHDFETQSTLDLKRVGAHRYSKHSTTQVWACAFAADDNPVKLWIPGDPVPAEFSEAANNPDWTTSAFNDQFERLVTANIMAPRHRLAGHPDRAPALPDGGQPGARTAGQAGECRQGAQP
jgi:hypothetical protein